MAVGRSRRAPVRPGHPRTGRRSISIARYLTTGFAAPGPNPPSPATRRLLTACLDLTTTPLLYEVKDRNPAALARLRAVDEALRSQREDRHWANALLALISNLVEDYADRPTGQKP
ncbi:hypothetical protein [Streptomyces xinghaiensis]|uniref:hypothetical protein n=1 Tax=Streptomyces xinghaiensis TaxID=1038928 RepID=UPI001EDCD173|nr:hypothetical protein [Streptomyces xinghaiensis]